MKFVTELPMTVKWMGLDLSVRLGDSVNTATQLDQVAGLYPPAELDG